MVASGELLTEQESAVYDRQIRVWGVDAQKRLSRSRVLVVGISGVVAETCKNIVLAGIGSLTLLDDTPPTSEAATTNFLIHAGDLDNKARSVAEVCVEALREYNPMVQVLAESGTITEKPGEFYDGFDVVILGRTSISLQRQVNAVCRSRLQKVAFYAVDSRYGYGSLFADLQTMTYTTKKLADKSDMEHTKVFPSLHDALSVPWSRLPKRTCKLFFAFRIAQEFEEKCGVNQSDESTTTTLRKFSRDFCASQGVPPSDVLDDLASNVACAISSELPPVCAIMGGILGQEVLKALSGKGEPLKNYFFFDSSDGKGIIEDISS